MTAVIVPYGIQSYDRSDLPAVRLVNLYAEAVPTSRATTALLPRPALSRYATLPTGPGYGLFRRPNTLGGDLFAVAGGTLYRSGTAVGSVGAAAQVQFAPLENALLLTTGTLSRYDGTLTAIAFPDGQAVSSIAYLGSISFATAANTRHIYFSFDNGVTWDGLDYVSAEQSTDPVIGLVVVGDQLIACCSRHSEIFYLTGDPDAPIQRVQGRVIDKGVRARDTIQRYDNTVVWVGQDNVVYRLDNAPLRISDHAIEQALKGSATAAAFSYSWFGHLFYVLQLDARTFSYDAATQQWHEVASRNLARWRAVCGIDDGEVLCGDDVDGTVWQLSNDLLTDDGVEVERVFTVLIPDRGYVDRIDLDAAKGIAATPSTSPGILEMRTSRDQGATWSDWRQTSLGKQGAYRKRVGFSRLGLVDTEGMIAQFRLTDPVVTRISSVALNESQAGRSR